MTTPWQSWAPIFNWQHLPDIPKNGINFAKGVRLEKLPKWVRSEEAIKDLHGSQRSEIRNYVKYGFRLDYDAASLGDPDPDYKGEEPRSRQNKAVELFHLANLALWISKPTPIRLPTYLHFDNPGDPKSIRDSGSGLGFSHHERDSDNKITTADIDLAIKLHSVLFNLDRKNTVWLTSRLVWKSLFERLWEIRVLIQWIALESVFGPQGGGELRYRIAQRIGFFLAKNREEAKEIFENAKTYYRWRSRIVHGDELNKLTREKSLDVSFMTQEYIRKSLFKILQNNNLIDLINEKRRELYFDSLIFGK